MSTRTTFSSIFEPEVASKPNAGKMEKIEAPAPKAPENVEIKAPVVPEVAPVEVAPEATQTVEEPKKEVNVLTFQMQKLQLLEKLAMAQSEEDLADFLKNQDKHIVDLAAKPIEHTEESITAPVTVEDMPAAGVSTAKDEINVDNMITQLKADLKRCGARGILGLGRKFRIMDDDNSKSIDLMEFKKAMKETCQKFPWTEEHFKALFDHFDADSSGTLSYDEFLVGVRGQLNERREHFVKLAFGIIDKDGNGKLELDDLIGRYDASKHPRVIDGSKTERQILLEFLNGFGDLNGDDVVDYDEFKRYYASISASIDDDDYFELMMRNAWHISGGEGWCENTSNKRVLLTMYDNTQKVMEVTNDFDVDVKSKKAVLKHFADRGIYAKDVSLNGDVQEMSLEAEATNNKVGPISPRRRGAGASSIVFG
eukprot:TRINITY_DN20933_c0_g1_i1.p1 TRINITY_DN20933_c0_g1~~TRINITY_DN20933_c0_g1_i1.p1  ORF type:complete len:425 (-),score=164.50 TRINITY_DN20933_c0_g1_i1:236-1510(-)